MRKLETFILAVLCLILMPAVPGKSGMSDPYGPAALKYQHWASLYSIDVNGSFGDGFNLSRVRQTSDGGLAIGLYGWGDHASWYGEQMAVLRLDGYGRKLWTTAPLTCGDNGECTVEALAVLSDGRIAFLAKYLYSDYESTDGYLVLMMLGRDGSFQWMKTFLGTYYAEGYYDLQPAPNGGMLIAGATKPGHWVARLDSTGRIRWQARLDAAIYSLQQTSDGGFIVAGASGGEPWEPSSDAWIAKFNALGAITWQKAIGDPAAADYFHRVVVMGDGYVAAGETRGFGAGDQDAWLVKFDLVGHVRWQKAFGRATASGLSASSIARLRDGGILVCGSSAAESSSYGFALKLNPLGNVVWQRQYPAAIEDGIELRSGDLALVGEPMSSGTCWPDTGYVQYAFAARINPWGRVGPDCCLVFEADLVMRKTVAIPYVTLYATIRSPATVRDLAPTDPGYRSSSRIAVCQADPY